MITQQPRLVAATATKYGIETLSQLVETSPDITSGLETRERKRDSNFFCQTQWTPDGTTLITTGADHQIRTYIVPPDLLEERETPHVLEPYTTVQSAESIYATTIYPGFNLQDPSTTMFISSMRDHPIRLNTALTSGMLASYPLVDQNTEAYICPHSLLFNRDGTRFLAGSDCLISVFDISRPGSEPMHQLATIPSKRRRNVGGGVGMKGIVSAFALEPNSSILAAGTFTGHVGIYTDSGEGDTIGVFPLAGSEGRKAIGGRGVTQVKWSSCGRYLYVAERMSDGVLIYDIRDTGQLLGWLEGRNAKTQQRMNIDIFSTNTVDGHEIWAGGMDGSVRVWTNPHQQEGSQKPDSQWEAHEDVVTSSVVHPLGSVIATTSGQYDFDTLPAETDSGAESDDDELSSIDNDSDPLLKIWSLSALSSLDASDPPLDPGMV